MEYVSTMSYYYSKSKHVALLLSAVCLVLCSETSANMKAIQKKERKMTRELENMSCEARMEELGV